MCKDGRCIECDKDDQCPAARRFCTKERVCVECEDKGDCPTDRPNCSAGVCKL
jgi:hypothetical protein